MSRREAVSRKGLSRAITKAPHRLLLPLAAAAVLLIPGSVYALTANAAAGSCVDGGDGGGGTHGWGSTANAEGAPDGMVASVGLAGSQTSNLLVCSGFGFNLPSGSIINGISLVITKSADGTQFFDADVSLLKGGSPSGNNKASSVAWNQFTLAGQNYGGSTDLWGTTWRPADINASNFGVELSVSNDATSDSLNAAVDAFELSVDYSIPPPQHAPVLGSPLSLPFMLVALGLAATGVLLTVRRGLSK